MLAKTLRRVHRAPAATSLGPDDPASTKPKMRSAVFLPPHRRVQRAGAIVMARKHPTWPFIRQKVHVQCSSTSAGTKHSSLFLITVVFDDVENPIGQVCRQIFGDNLGPVRRITPIGPSLRDAPAEADEPRADSDEEGNETIHEQRLSASSIRPRRGLVSPMPTLAPRISQMPSSGSVMISMLAREKITLANTSLGSSR